ncbi:hypothetical protein GIB67_003542 [Kingdonia uniflora]|uniref:TF-B3 domain-containing protein n=1 Tax=Kingdonia uniflora TaxID=39325 RepID=A0A7J7MEW9_9MAGN|nr:hypothetical protein GIB67_003542 [Kingdonia uniflora]
MMSSLREKDEVMEEDQIEGGERPKSAVLVPSFVSASTAASAGEQQGFVRYGTQQTTALLGLKDSWSPPLVGNPYHYEPYPCNGLYEVEVSGNSYDSRDTECRFARGTNGFIQDSAFHNGFVPVQANFQNALFPPSVRKPSSNNFMSSPFNKYQGTNAFATCGSPPPNCSMSPSFTKDQEMNTLATSRAPWNDCSLATSGSIPIHNSNGIENCNVESSETHGFAPFREAHTRLEATSKVSRPLASEGYDWSLPSKSSYKPEIDKEIEGKGWIVLVQKELRNTDVGNLRRIVLPKKDAEANLPPLVAKDGIFMQMEDLTYPFEWEFKFRYWPNNKSRMYVMENTGDFVRMHNLQTGDFFVVYKEEHTGKYIVHGKKANRSLYNVDTVEELAAARDLICLKQGHSLRNEGPLHFIASALSGSTSMDIR